MEKNAPWINNYGDVPFHIEYPEGSMYDALYKTCEELPNKVAISYMGRNITYASLLRMIDTVAEAFIACGVKPGDKITLCLPNIPQTVYCLYALNHIGAIACMMHPLSAVEEIAPMMTEAGSEFAVTLDSFAWKFDGKVKTLIVCSAGDELGFIKKIGFKLINAKKAKKPIPANAVLWDNFISSVPEDYDIPAYKADKNAAAVVLFSGGTTGVTKAILLSNLNLNALARQTEAMCAKPVRGKLMLAAMPMFHGFGLGVCVHTMMVAGGTSVLVPQFNVKQYAALVRKKRPNYIAGVPTLFEALTRSEELRGVKLDCLMGVFSGGDSLSVELKKKMDAFLADHGATVRIREGYGTTECVTASCLTPLHTEREGSIGLPYPDTYYAICSVDGTEMLPYGEEGEICLRGPSVMLGYIGHEDENAKALRLHDDGNIWLHTGDLGVMDEDGFIYFRQRIKRMIISSGYNIYPSRLENIIDAHPAVRMSCVIGVKDDYKMQKVKAFVVPAEGYTPDEALKAELMEYCRKHIAKYALPYDIEFRAELPKTTVGKVAYTVLEKEEEAKSRQ